MIKRAAFTLFLFLFILSPLSFNLLDYLKKAQGWYESGSSIIIDEDETWHKGDNLIFSKDIYIENGATLTIEPGTVIKFSRDSNWNAPTLNVLGGRIFASGTQEEPIIFTASSSSGTFFINFKNTPDYLEKAVLPSFFRFVEIRKAGTPDMSGPVQSFYKRPSFFSVALAAVEGTAAFYYQGGKMHIENSRFYNSGHADIEVLADNSQSEADDYLEIVNSNFEGENDQFALKSNLDCKSYNDMDCVSNIILKDNWYGDDNGPTEDDSPTQKGKKITGQYGLQGWRTDATRKDPVIIVPGIMGSSEVNGEWKLDPITHTYDNLIESLVRNGYAKNKNIFEFPYDWKKRNETTAGYLETKIDEITNATKISKVDLVAHSMGGLVARSYIEMGGYERKNVDQLITLGTPHHGSPLAYLYWEAGEGFFNVKERIVKHHFIQEAKHNGYDTLFAYIRARVPSIAELLPDYNYLIDADSQSEKEYLYDNYPRNIFLEELNADQNREKLSQVDFMNIVGETENAKTISEIRVESSGSEGKWENGVPENFYNNDTDQGLNYSNGDLTVPLRSASDIETNQPVSITSSHNDLPTKAQCIVIAELTGMLEGDCQYTTVFNITNILLINVFSPIDIQVVAPDGKRVGKNFTNGEIFNEIDGAYYSGYDGIDSEFITIPDPEDGEYQILTQGTDNGAYKIEASKITEDENDVGVTVESSKSIEGQANLGQSEKKTVKLREEKIEISASVDVTALMKTAKQYANRNLIKTRSGADDILNLLKFIKQYDDKIKNTEKSNLSEDKKQKEIDSLKKNFNRRVDVLSAFFNKPGKMKILDVSIRESFLNNIVSLKKA